MNDYLKKHLFKAILFAFQGTALLSAWLAAHVLISPQYSPAAVPSRNLKDFGYRFLFVVLFTCCLFTDNVLATEPIRSLATDRRLKVVAYHADNVVPVVASTFTATQIVFGKNEIIENIQNGDLVAWTVSVPKGLPHMLFLKPTIIGSHTNMTVVTNRHTYYFQLDSEGPQSVDSNLYAIHFTYPEVALTKRSANVRYNKKQTLVSRHQSSQYNNWDYSVSGDGSVVPLHIFDDGRFTYLQLKLGQPVPAVFAVTNSAGSESVVNYRREGQYMVIQQVAPQFTLRAGNDHVASVFNNRLIQQLKLRREG